ncbi:hypothetical protein CFC21_049121 [Triticum aestivum]|uniref:DUF4220 domain-containing protein n=2 Tax=Triticum aestivum TaxID=4565 RepID=A0A3B5ZY84_WHEAT|nr:hypothetical protein CFC21_049121 [Triticum aestivum]
MVGGVAAAYPGAQQLVCPVLLFFSIWVRRVPCLRRLRAVVWLAYIGGDALAIYALATLFDRHQQRTTDVVGESSSSGGGLEVLWAPVLLIHLGGQVTLSAFSLEDNELWLRHVITLVSQVTVALYVFCKWWSGELKLLLAAVMLFVFGILKFSLKPLALRRASYSQMLASTDVSLSREGEKKEGDGATGDKALSLDEYVQKAKDMMCAVSCDSQAAEPAMKKAATSSDHEAEPISIRHICYFVNMYVPYVARLSDLQYLQNPPPPQKDNFEMENTPYNILQKCFHLIFEKLYSREGYNTIEEVLTFLLPLLAVASMVLFAMSHKDGYNSRDVKVTYILFSCTTMVELLLLLTATVLGCAVGCIPSLEFLYHYINGWHDMVSQYDLMSFYVRKKRPTFLMKLVLFECLREYVSKVWYVRQVPAAREITELVQQHIEDGWKKFISDATTYKRFGNFRGQLTLSRLSDQQCDLGEELSGSLEVPFDKSILLWHIATNLYFHRPVDKPSSSVRSQRVLTKRSMEMSNYMLYLLFIRTEMLLPGTRPGLFSVAVYKLEDILKNSKENLENEEALAQEIIKHTDGRTLIHEACRLAVSLMKLDEEEMWQTIQGVWVEMLCYSASRCRGLLHAKSLGEDGEYLSYVWLLWSYMGMETLADKLQKPESPTQKEIITLANELTSTSQGRLNRQSSNGGISSPV